MQAEAGLGALELSVLNAYTTQDEAHPAARQQHRRPSGEDSGAEPG